MKSLFKIVLLLVFAVTLFACNPDNSPATVKIKDYQEVYDENIVEIEDYLKENYLELDADLNATVTKIPENGTQTSIWNQTDYPLQSITVKNDSRSTLLTDGRIEDDVDYKLYYIVLNEGGGENVTSVDSTLVAYKGWNLTNEVFDLNNFGVWFSFPESSVSAISGFRQILSKVKTEESHVENSNGTVTRVNYGNVLVFIPSGLAYFSGSRENINQYAPIAFQIKLFDLKTRDHDRDRIPNIYEDLNNNNDYFDDDSDGDKIPDFLDVDDDGDGKLTKFEIRMPIPATSPYQYYDFNSIPVCAQDPNGKKVHLSNYCR